ncbi:unnamed protein product [Dimorphilus gyrociliatus]|uniref:RING-type domain-containing protein n=1 Tax=Dimorphilus gyrociliatus TaxID=2664684 RepID=A0A7I8VEN3_9ANNE|nr:unnamed protein product [Dimorphilus gyrociliatus]
MEEGKFIINEKSLECSICLENWLSRDSRALPCQHIFCFECLIKASTKNVICCPICRKNTSLTKKGVIGLPRNLLSDSIKWVRNLTEGTKEICEKHKIPFIHPRMICKTCEVDRLCSHCIDFEHNMTKCNICSYKNIYSELEPIRQIYKDVIQQYKGIVTEDGKKLEQTFQVFSNKAQLILKEELGKIEDQIKAYNDGKKSMLNLLDNSLTGVFINRKKLEEKLEKCLSVRLVFSGPPKITVNSYLEEKTVVNNDLMGFLTEVKAEIQKPGLDEKGVINNILSLYYLSENFLFNYKPSYGSGQSEIIKRNNNKVLKVFDIPSDFHKFIVIFPYIYVVYEDREKLVKGRLTETERIKFEVLKVSKRRIINIFSVEYKEERQRVLLIESDCLYSHELIQNEQTVWRRNRIHLQCVSACSKPNGDIFVTSTNLFAIIDKSSGMVKRQIEFSKIVPPIEGEISLVWSSANLLLLCRRNQSKIEIYNEDLRIVKITPMKLPIYRIDMLSENRFAVIHSENISKARIYELS